MTLVLTEISPLGIAMAADSAVTFTNLQTGLSYAQPNLARKLQPIPYLNAGISCWGMGTIDNVATDQWVANFIAANSKVKYLKDFAELLAVELNAQLPANASGENRLGFHLAGYEDLDGVQEPSLFHIHDGPSTVLAERGIKVDPHRVNANHDVPPSMTQQIRQTGVFPLLRNGDYNLYANIFGLLEEFFQQLIPIGIRIPNSQNLRDRADYLAFQIRTVSEIYRLSNLLPGIGGGIHYLTIGPNGIHSQGVNYF